ncbi:MAG: hypothetical protein HC819_21855 [Cyclobacteriaceae bacterium]|nr:hypothetical protein [Cyclobacteriaceae bacterium]
MIGFFSLRLLSESELSGLKDLQDESELSGLKDLQDESELSGLKDYCLNQNYQD